MDGDPPCGRLGRASSNPDPDSREEHATTFAAGAARPGHLPLAAGRAGAVILCEEDFRGGRKAKHHVCE